MERSEAIRLYREMCLIRRFEERASDRYQDGKIGGYFHTYIGQEAIAVGIAAILTPEDYVIDSYRDHGHCLALGSDPNLVMAELHGKKRGLCQGKGGSMHLFDKERRFLGGTGIVGAGIPIGTGAAFAIKYRGGSQVCVNFFGDGALNEGAFHESLNLASLWSLPIIFVCENNHYGMSTPVSKSSSLESLVERAAGYGIEREAMNGMDVRAVLSTARRVVDYVRQNSRPYFIEAITYRYLGHGAQDPNRYRTRQEIEEWRLRDPIQGYAAYLLGQKLATESDLETIHAEVNEVVEGSIRFSEESPEPEPDALYEHVYV
ncbi:MAG: pyruvate dehydrogenase (acetyl-transferring) E1 component subunit alpha [Armatimonadetes bacterium]|nr:pyruvate dehydrogenase (acetyl-transferring) E1 component subunit alpha [Armatimonadota bacterium]